MEYIGQIMKDVTAENYVGMKRLAGNREEWRANTNQSLE
jgi:hypothetical protein